jgi:hypothetical protein
MFCAVVTDEEGVGTVDRVYADIWHPEGPPENGSFKHQLELFRVPKETEGGDAIARFEAAYAQGLVEFGPGYDYDDVIHQLNQCLADVYCGEFGISYHQPAGRYKVGVKAYDLNNNPSEVLFNHFEYVAVHGCEFDFDSVSYGPVEVCTNKWIGGDINFGTAAPTVRNIGNTYIKITVAQDDMGLGMTDGNWNVEFDARLGATGTHVIYDPYEEAIIPDVLPLCNTQKLDFSIHVKKADPNTYTGLMTLGCIEAPFSPGD